MKGQRILVCVWVLGLLLVLAVGLSRAQGPEPPQGEARPQGETGVTAIVGDVIPIQGRLTDADGNPVADGDYTLTFRLYDVSSEGEALCEDTDGPPGNPLDPAVPVTNGLFTAYMNGCTADVINGRQLWLGIEVGSDGEMEPRQRIYPVPYAWSLRPGAIISGTVTSNAVVHAENSASGGRALRGYATAASGINYGVVGTSWSPDGYGGYFQNNGGGVALKAAGSGVIQSTARSYLWISGNSLQKANSDDTTRWQYDDYGGYQVYSGSADGGLRRVVLPVTIPGQLYGQNVTVTGLDLYYAIEGEFTVIDAVIVRRQDGVGTGDQILYDDNDLTCGQGLQCTKHWDLTQNNVLSDQLGILHLVLRFSFPGSIEYIQIGGVRLTLEHD